MNRFEQRLQKRLQNKEIAAGYQEMDAELNIMHAIDEVRERQYITLLDAHDGEGPIKMV